MLTLKSLLTIFEAAGVKLSQEKVKEDWPQQGGSLDEGKALSRKAIAWLIDKYLQPFERPVNMKGALL